MKNLHGCLGLLVVLSHIVSCAPVDQSTLTNQEIEEKEPRSEAVITLAGVQEGVFSSPVSIFSFKIDGADFTDDLTKVAVLTNGNRVENTDLKLDSNRITVRSPLSDGQNEIELITEDSKGNSIEKSFQVLLGSKTVKLALPAPSGNLVVKSLTHPSVVQTIPIARSAAHQEFTLKALPNSVPIEIQFQTKNGQLWSRILDSEQSSEKILLKETPSFNAEGIVQSASLFVQSKGVEPQTLIRSFEVPARQNIFRLRYRFTTLETKLNPFENVMDDFYSITISSRKLGTILTESQSIKSLGENAFDQEGNTSEKDLALNVDPSGDTVDVVMTAANRADAYFDSTLTANVPDTEDLMITWFELFETDQIQSSLQFLSLFPHTYYTSRTLFTGRLELQGIPEDQVDSLTLDILQWDSPLAEATLTTSGQNLLNTLKFDSSGKLTLTSTVNSLFQIPSGVLDRFDDTRNDLITVRLNVRTRSGAFASALYPASLGLLTRYTNRNRYPNCGTSTTCRDPSEGGDDWILPSSKRFNEDMGPDYLFGDMSNLNGGYFISHSSHRMGNDIDTYFDGYNSRNEAAARRIISLLNDDSLGPRIKLIFVTFTSEFARVIQNTRLENGEPASQRVLNLSNHQSHFHIRLR